MFDFLKAKVQQPQTLGQIGEEFAQQHYRQRGYKIVAANFFNKKGLRKGEVDFVATDDRAIAFVEVKTRASNKSRFGTAQESVNYFKQQKLLKAVKLFLLANPKYNKLVPRIDVCAVIIGEHSPLELISTSPAKYTYKCPLDKLPFSATILMNAVEDWN